MDLGLCLALRRGVDFLLANLVGNRNPLLVLARAHVAAFLDLG